jgi:hypothetical protein
LITDLPIILSAVHCNQMPQISRVISCGGLFVFTSLGIVEGWRQSAGGQANSRHRQPATG